MKLRAMKAALSAGKAAISSLSSPTPATDDDEPAERASATAELEEGDGSDLGMPLDVMACSPEAVMAARARGLSRTEASSSMAYWGCSFVCDAERCQPKSLEERLEGRDGPLIRTSEFVMKASDEYE